jgi:hypothetical protein
MFPSLLTQDVPHLAFIVRFDYGIEPFSYPCFAETNLDSYQETQDHFLPAALPLSYRPIFGGADWT